MIRMKPNTTPRSFSQIKRSLTKFGAATLLIAGTLLIPHTASALEISETGCVEWSEEWGCMQTVTCTVETNTGWWTCKYYFFGLFEMRQVSGQH